MRIVAVDARFERFALVRPYAISFRPLMDEVENAIVEIRTETGRVGLGAGSPEHFVTGETRERCAQALSPARLEWLIGKDVRELPALCRELERRLPHAPAARAAIDIALHDLLAQSLGVPLVDMLGRAHRALPTSITIGLKPLEETLAEADEYRARGFRILKVKLGASLEADLERIARVRERVGPAMPIRVDPNQGYTVEEVLKFCAATAHLGLEFLEQPTSAKDPTALRSLPEPIRARVAADEILLDERDALSLVAPPAACGIFNIKLMKCGGVRAALRIATIAECAGTELMWGCMDESVISIAAALHAAFSSPATRYLDLDGSLDLARDVAAGGFVIDEGVMRTTDAPGLGVRALG
jgi:L-alanine-DL-glutamate epimerase-like enolase superfamily enzyme